MTNEADMMRTLLSALATMGNVIELIIAVVVFVRLKGTLPAMLIGLSFAAAGMASIVLRVVRGVYVSGGEATAEMLFVLFIGMNLLHALLGIGTLIGLVLLPNVLSGPMPRD